VQVENPMFKDQSLQQQVLARRHRRAPAIPKKTFSELKFDENRAILEPFLPRLLELGRLPEADECDGYQAVAEKFGSAGRALLLLKRVTGLPGWREMRRQRTDDLLVYLALARFRNRPPLAKLSPTLQRDMRAFFFWITPRRRTPLFCTARRPFFARNIRSTTSLPG